jgi:hypothetical protein
MREFSGNNNNANMMRVVDIPFSCSVEVLHDQHTIRLALPELNAPIFTSEFVSMTMEAVGPENAMGMLSMAGDRLNRKVLAVVMRQAIAHARIQWIERPYRPVQLAEVKE